MKKTSEMSCPLPLLTEFSFHEKNGVYMICTSSFFLKEAAVSMCCGKKSIPLKNWKLVSSSGTHEENTLLEYETKNVYGKYFLSFTVTHDEVTVALSAKLKKDLPELTFYYFREAKSVLPDHILCRSMNLPGGSSCAFLPAKAERSKKFSSFDSLFTKEKDKQLFFSFPMASDHIPRLSHDFKKRGKRSTLTLTAEITLPAFEGENITLPPLSLKFASSKELHSFPVFQKENIPSEKLPSPPCAWNSWDYYRWTITEAEVLKNAEFIASDPVLSKHVKRIIIDDGWQYAYGEWVHNGLFPSGMSYIAKELKKMGFEPGLWIAPGIVENVSRIAQNRYDMLAKSLDGYPAMMFSCMERRGFILDPTNKDVHEYWFRLFDEYASMGYKFFKLDFLAPIINVPLVKDKSIPRGRFLDLLFETVTKAVDGRARLMACGYPYLSGNPGVEAVRVGQDIHAKWDCVKVNTSAVASLYALGDTHWINDPDFALCRGVDTSNDPSLNIMRPCLVYNKKEGGNNPSWNTWSLATNTKSEAEVLLSIVLISGGARTLSDAIYLLNEDGLLLARKVVSAAPGKAGVPLDLFTEEIPCYYLQNLANGAYRVLFVNWSDEEKEFSLDLEKYNLTLSKGKDFWKGTEIKLQNGFLNKLLPRHSCLLAEFYP